MEQIKSLISSVDFYMNFQVLYQPYSFLSVTVRRVTPQNYSYFIVELK